jgi:hypothetical protein
MPTAFLGSGRTATSTISVGLAWNIHRVMSVANHRASTILHVQTKIDFSAAKITDRVYNMLGGDDISKAKVSEGHLGSRYR